TAGLFRLWIERVFTIAGFGTVLSGIPTSGQAQVGDKLRIVPGGQVGRVRGLEVYGRKADVGRAGQCVAVNLADIDYDALRRGEVLCHAEAFEPVRMVEAELQLLPGVRQPLKDYAEVHLHVGTAEAMANVAMLEAHPLLPGERQMVQLRVQEPLGIAPGDRFVIRAGMPGVAGGGVTTIGGGRVLGTSDRRLRRNRPWTLASLAARRDAIDSPRAWCELNLKEAAEAISAAALARRAQMPADRVEALLEELAGEGVALKAAARAFAHRDVVDDLAGGLADALAEYHAANPDRAGMEESELHAGAGVGRALFDLALAKLAADGAIERRGPLVWRAGRSVKLSPEDREVCGRIESTLQAAGLAAPRPAELAESLGVDPKRLAALIRLLADQGVLAELDPKVVLHRKAVEAAKKVAIDLFARQGSFETVEFRDALGVSRKYAVPLLDYFDTIRLTVRSGSRRTPGAVAKDILAGKQTL
ncbi:MAG TPA: SelB C-terminal domain-containing protein, partial [Phycisphaerae bacterium]|nr:SelB C-terminal domain-containing protein [Phycisphaerae bacterium]